MATTTVWDNEAKTILYTHIEGRWTLDEHYRSIETSRAMLAEVDHPVVFILDFSESGPPPAKLLTAGRNMSRGQSPNLEQIVFVNANRLMEMLIDVIRKIYPSGVRKMAFADTVDDARLIARETLAQAD